MMFLITSHFVIDVPILSSVVVLMTFWTLKTLSPRFGKLVSEEARQRGLFRFAHTRIICHAEEIAFFDGHQVCFTDSQWCSSSCSLG